MLISNARPWAGKASDILIEDGKIAAITEHDPTREPGADDVDGRGRILIALVLRRARAPRFDTDRTAFPAAHRAAPGVWGMMMQRPRATGGTPKSGCKNAWPERWSA